MTPFHWLVTIVALMTVVIYAGIWALAKAAATGDRMFEPRHNESTPYPFTVGDVED